MADPRTKMMENLPGMDEYGSFVIEKTGYSKDGGLYINVRYDTPGINPATYWYYNADGSTYKSNPDGSSTYKSANGTVVHRSHARRKGVFPLVTLACVRDRSESGSLPYRASGLLLFGWPMLLVYPGPFLVTISMNVFLFFLLFSVCALFSQKDCIVFC